MIAGVWAPRAEVVDLVGADGSRTRLARGADGWFRGGDLGPGDRYGFALDGGDPLPDPRSRWQPDGIDGLSSVDEPSSTDWADAAWKGFHLPGSVLYELHVGTFTAEGTLDAAIGRLSHLVDLGIDAVELLPVAEAMGERGWGYDGVGLFAVHHAYGGPAALRRFVEAAHAHGIGVLLDVVYNHLGPQGNHLGRFGPYFSEAHHTPWGAGLNLDGEGSAEVRRFVLDNARQWLDDFHLDGLRLDATHALLDDSPTHLLAELHDEVAALAARLGRSLWLVAEREQEELLPILPRVAGGWGLDARWSDDLHHAIHSATTGEVGGYYAPYGFFEDIGTALLEGHVRDGDALPAELSSHHLVVCAQNHDQIGNRALGERLGHLIGVGGAMGAAAVVLTSPGTPLLFQGEEWAASTPFPYFCDTADPDLADAIRDGRRAEFAGFGWDPESIPDPLAAETAASAVLRWEELGRPQHARVLAWYRALIRLRRLRPDLVDGRRAGLLVETDEDRRLVVVRRPSTIVAVSWSLDVQAVEVGEVTVLASSTPVSTPTAGFLALPPMSAAVLAVSEPLDPVRRPGGAP